jgi:hypothetical protein
VCGAPFALHHMQLQSFTSMQGGPRHKGRNQLKVLHVCSNARPLFECSLMNYSQVTIENSILFVGRHHYDRKLTKVCPEFPQGLNIDVSRLLLFFSDVNLQFQIQVTSYSSPDDY